MKGFRRYSWKVLVNSFLALSLWRSSKEQFWSAPFKVLSSLGKLSSWTALMITPLAWLNSATEGRRKRLIGFCRCVGLLAPSPGRFTASFVAGSDFLFLNSLIFTIRLAKLRIRDHQLEKREALAEPRPSGVVTSETQAMTCVGTSGSHSSRVIWSCLCE